MGWENWPGPWVQGTYENNEAGGVERTEWMNARLINSLSLVAIGLSVQAGKLSLDASENLAGRVWIFFFFFFGGGILYRLYYIRYCPVRTSAKKFSFPACSVLWNMASNWLASITLLWLIGLNIGWDCLVSHCIVGPCDQREFLFFRWYWQSCFTALMAGISLPLGLCKGTVKGSTSMLTPK